MGTEISSNLATPANWPMDVAGHRGVVDLQATGASTGPVELSVVIPLYNEEDNVGPAVEEVLSVLNEIPRSSELILVDDGSRDNTGSLAFSWQLRDPRVRVIQFRRNFGQTAAITAGYDAASGEVVVLMDGDQQNDPRDIPMLLDKMAEGYDVVSGWRVNRKDKLLMRKLPSHLANRLISRATGTVLHDYGCTLKVYDASVLRQIRLYGEMHRFIPALASVTGARVAEVPVNHRPRTRGSSKYGISRTVRVLLDLLTVKFLLAYLTRPIQFFGRIALISVLSAVLSVAVLISQHMFGFQALRGDTWVTLAAMLLTLGVIVLCVGILGEVMTRAYYESAERRTYVVRSRAGFCSGTAEAPAIAGNAEAYPAPSHG
ncbi:MAG TPA: glycosyltransferase family 2 protein [Acidimicrobiales bacterium]|nr:glycosyltransferase family 2 protein [Acidimicrobiales bacterium]